MWRLHMEREELGWTDPLLLKLEDLKLPPPPYPKRIYVRDDRIFGFALQLTERGKVSFVFECRIRVDGKSKSHRETFREGRGTTLEHVKEARNWAAKLELQHQAGTLYRPDRRRLGERDRA